MWIFHCTESWCPLLLNCSRVNCIYHILFIRSSVDGDLGYFHILVIVNNAAVNLSVQIFKTLLLILLGVYPEVELLDHIIFWIFWGIVILFSTVAAPICIPPTVYKGSLFSTFSPTFVICVFWYSHSDKCEVISHCGFNLHFSDS